ncbi:MAG: hypothetical protein H6755_05330 [Candidatus Omnitrophica bacterium]|nr:hypothetical protein [Candidatus Omnitrophota bacterium]MCB9747814.1 hypothetical protein [Candidatus Omnitrophota bacterium]
MKKALVLFIVLALIGMAAPVFAGDMPAPIDKLTGGFVEIIKSPLALYEHPKSEMEGHDHMAIGLVKGLVEAPFHFVKRAGGGVLDVVTFPIE